MKKVTPAKLKVRGDANENVDTNNSEKSVDSVETAEVVLHDRQSQSQIDIAKFNFGDFNTGSEYDVVINKGGETVPIQAPKLEYYNTPKSGFMNHHLYFGCEFPLEMGNTIIPVSGMYDYFFLEGTSNMNMNS